MNENTKRTYAEEFVDKAKAELQLFFGIDNPTEQQVAMFVLFGIVRAF